MSLYRLNEGSNDRYRKNDYSFKNSLEKGRPNIFHNDFESINSKTNIYGKQVPNRKYNKIISKNHNIYRNNPNDNKNINYNKPTGILKINRRPLY